MHFLAVFCLLQWPIRDAKRRLGWKSLFFRAGTWWTWATLSFHQFSSSSVCHKLSTLETRLISGSGTAGSCKRHRPRGLAKLQLTTACFTQTESHSADSQNHPEEEGRKKDHQEQGKGKEKWQLQFFDFLSIPWKPQPYSTTNSGKVRNQVHEQLVSTCQCLRNVETIANYCPTYEDCMRMHALFEHKELSFILTPCNGQDWLAPPATMINAFEAQRRALL